MLQIEDKIVSLDIIETNFVCDLSHCKGECCIEGDAGAPLEEEELTILQEILPKIWNDLLPSAQAEIEKRGVAYVDEDGDLVTTIVNGKDCVFTSYTADGTCYCAIEKAYREGRISYYKPISCHLYPIRIAKYKEFSAVNYHRWKVCKAAEILGNTKGVKIYQFLKEPLIRKYGEAWYNQLCTVAEEWNKTKSKN